MFDFLKKKKLCLYAPVTGHAIDLSKVPDDIFAQKLMGNGLAFKFDGDRICAPCDGKILLIAETKHALGIRADNGAEIMIHIGLDTVNLNGEGFQVMTSKGKNVKAGDLLIQIDRKFMDNKNINLITPMIITNTSEYQFQVINLNTDVKANIDKVIVFE
jgi:glucose-specific phosphotransferase system IIA component